MADIYVSTTGSDSNAGTQDSPFKTILKASQVATAGTTVHVAPGTYQGGFKTTTSGTESAPIHYVSDVKWGAKIVPPANSTSDTAWNNRGDHVTIDGFEVDGSGSYGGTQWRWGIYTGGDQSSIVNSKVHDIARNTTALGDSNGGAGIQGDGYYGGSDFTLSNNVVYNVGPAGDTNGLIHGIYISSSGTVENNEVSNVPGVGIHLWHDAHDVRIADNTVYENGAGILVGAGDFVHEEAPADHVEVVNNSVYDNAENGITEQGLTGPNNTYVNNKVWGNGNDWDLDPGKTHTGTVATPQSAAPLAVDLPLDLPPEYLAYVQMQAAGTVPATSDPAAPTVAVVPVADDAAHAADHVDALPHDLISASHG